MTKKDRIGAMVAGALIYPALFVALLWGIKLTEVFFELDFSEYALVPRHLIGLRGILFAPLLHQDFPHLISNSLPLLMLGGLLFYVYPKSAKEVSLGIYFTSGIWVWAGAREAYHLGASGLVYGLASFLFFSGLIRREKVSMSIAMLVVLFYGSMIWGIFPILPNMSWESHLFGGLAGAIIAFLYRKKDQAAPEVPPSFDSAIDADDLPWNQFDGPEGNPLPPPPVEEPPAVVFRYYYKSEEAGERGSE